jgi:hypothetical protein
MQNDGGNLAMCRFDDGSEVSLWAYKNDKARDAAAAGGAGDPHNTIIGEPAWLAIVDEGAPVGPDSIAKRLDGKVAATSPTPPAPKPAPDYLLYKVVSDGGISSVDWTTANFGNEQDTDVAGNTWSKKISPDDVDIPVLEAQNAGSGNITCYIIRDGSVVVKQTSHGEYAVVTCSVGG